MPRYNVTAIRTYHGTIMRVIDASSATEAIRIAEYMLDNKELSLQADEYESVALYSHIAAT